MCTGGSRKFKKPPTSPASPSTPGPCFGSHARVRDPTADRISPACAGLHRSRGRSPRWAAKRGQAADTSELSLRILMHRPAPAVVISHAVRHMTERWHPSSGWASCRLRAAAWRLRPQVGECRSVLDATVAARIRVADISRRAGPGVAVGEPRLPAGALRAELGPEQDACDH